MRQTTPYDDFQLLRQLGQVARKRIAHLQGRSQFRGPLPEHIRQVLAGVLTSGEGNAMVCFCAVETIPLVRPVASFSSSFVFTSTRRQWLPVRALHALHIDRPVPFRAHDLRQPERIVGIRFVDLHRERRLRMTGVNAHDGYAGCLQCVPMPHRQRTLFPLLL